MTEDEKESLPELFGDLRGHELEDRRFKNAHFIGTDARQAKFVDCVFEQCVLSSVKLDDAALQVEFAGSKIEGINFFTAKKMMMSLTFENCLIRYCSFAGLKLKQVSFAGCTLQHVDFADADLTECDLSGATFEECVFNNTNLTKADFRGARGYQIDPTRNRMRGAKFNLPEVLGLLAGFGIVVE